MQIKRFFHLLPKDLQGIQGRLGFLKHKADVPAPHPAKAFQGKGEEILALKNNLPRIGRCQAIIQKPKHSTGG